MKNKWVSAAVFLCIGFIIHVIAMLFHFPVVLFALLPALIAGAIIAVVIGLIRKQWADSFTFFIGWILGSYYSLNYFINSTYDIMDKLS